MLVRGVLDRVVDLFAELLGRTILITGRDDTGREQKHGGEEKGFGKNGGTHQVISGCSHGRSREVGWDCGDNPQDAISFPRPGAKRPAGMPGKASPELIPAGAELSDFADVDPCTPRFAERR